MQVIEKEAFAETPLRNFAINSNVCQFNGGCFINTETLIIELLPNNQNYSNYKNIAIFGKSYSKCEFYDILVFVKRFVTTVVVPPYIREIAPYAFNECTYLREVKFSNKSELKIIGDHAFCNSGIAKIKIPSSVTFIGEKAFCKCKKLTKVDFDPNSKLKTINKKLFCYSEIEVLSIPSNIEKLNESWCCHTKGLNTIILDNPRFVYYENKFLLGQSNPKSDIFDVLLFANRDIKTAEIPSFIKEIAPYAFEQCYHMLLLD